MKTTLQQYLSVFDFVTKQIFALTYFDYDRRYMLKRSKKVEKTNTCRHKMYFQRDSQRNFKRTLTVTDYIIDSPDKLVSYSKYTSPDLNITDTDYIKDSPDKLVSYCNYTSPDIDYIKDSPNLLVFYCKYTSPDLNITVTDYIKDSPNLLVFYYKYTSLDLSITVTDYIKDSLKNWFSTVNIRLQI